MQVNYTRPNIYRAAGVKLYPGVNDVPADKVEKFMAHKAVKERVESGVIQVVGEKAEDKETVKEVAARVAEMTDKAELAALAKEDDRQGVQKAVENRLAELG